MVILHIVDVKKPNGNGVIVAVDNYAKYESNKCDVAIYNLGNDITEYINSGVSVFSKDDFSILCDLPSPYNRPDLIVFNEIYKPEYLKLYKECKINSIPYIIIPHGCLVKDAQNKKKLKKKVANLLLFNRFVYNSVALQYLNENELKSSVVKNHKYIISGNGVDLPKKTNKSKNKNFVFIGRYDVKVKGLDMLLRTIYNNKLWFKENNVNILLYGRTSGNGYDELKNMIERYDISSIVTLNDAVYGKDKEKVLLDSYAFIQVSRHEGQPMGIMEALSYRLPCIVTYGTSFGEYVNDNECGIGINFDEKELFGSIKKMYLDELFRNKCSDNAEIIEKDYEWEMVVDNCLNEYAKLI